jgi:hypothetical protein
MCHITGADDKVELEREVLRKFAFVVRDHNVMSTELLNVFRLVRGRGEGIDLSAEGVSEEDCVVAL